MWLPIMGLVHTGEPVESLATLFTNNHYSCVQVLALFVTNRPTLLRQTDRLLPFAQGQGRSGSAMLTDTSGNILVYAHRALGLLLP